MFSGSEVGIRIDQTLTQASLGAMDLIKIGTVMTVATVIVYSLWASLVIPALVK